MTGTMSAAYTHAQHAHLLRVCWNDFFQLHLPCINAALLVRRFPQRGSELSGDKYAENAPVRRAGGSTIPEIEATLGCRVAGQSFCKGGSTAELSDKRINVAHRMNALQCDFRFQL